MSDIAIFCDGSWNSPDQPFPTSVFRLHQALKAQATDGIKLFYDPGVGVREPDDPEYTWWEEFSGGALGAGLTKNIADCYRALIDLYAPGDRIHIFGFSRGAYTARSLAGLLRNCGLPSTPDHVDAALAWYRRRDPASHPGSASSHAFRAQISPRVHTSSEEAAWRRAQGIDTGDPMHLAYLGIYDTVGAHGIAGVLGQFRRVAPGGHGFHDHDLSSLVRSGRHAMALDETRVLYRPTPWANLARLNADALEAGAATPPYLQQWFPGSHSKVGGSGEDRQISNRVLDWVFAGSVAAGLPAAPLTDPDLALADGDHLGPLHNPSSGFDITGLLRFGRRGPAPFDEDALHPVAQRRVADDASYRPASLRRLLLSRR